jgi:AcrR family transcriptional regulator
MQDLETRDRLQSTAARLFAERGFSKVTVRHICRQAKANVAAVNYHFRGKTGLYGEVLHAAIETMQGTTEAARQAGEGRPPAEQLDAYISVFLQRMIEGRDSWIHQLMMRELSDPTPALDMVVAQVIRPRLAYLATIVAALIGCSADDPRVARSVTSVQAQIHAQVVSHPLADRLRDRRSVTPDEVREIARHITRFSLAGIEAMRTPRPSGSPTGFPSI